MQERHAASEFGVEFVRDFVRDIRHNHYRIHFIESLNHNVNHFGNHEVGKERIHCLIPAEEKPRAAQDKQIYKHDDFADRPNCFLVNDNRNNLRAVERAARPHNQADAHAVNYPPKNRRQKRIVRDFRILPDDFRPHAQKTNRYNRGDDKILADLLIRQPQERDIERD